MARDEADREDLFAEGTALRQRVELLLPGEPEPVVAGCRANRAWSIYFGADPCYHFDADGRLRRAYVEGHLYRTQGDTLARLIRVRTDQAVELQRTDLSVDECAAFVDTVRLRLEELHREIVVGATECRRQVPEDVDVAALLSGAVERILTSGPRLSPAIATRRT